MCSHSLLSDVPAPPNGYMNLSGEMPSSLACSVDVKMQAAARLTLWHCVSQLLSCMSRPTHVLNAFINKGSAHTSLGSKSDKPHHRLLTYTGNKSCGSSSKSCQYSPLSLPVCHTPMRMSCSRRLWRIRHTILLTLDDFLVLIDFDRRERRSHIVDIIAQGFRLSVWHQDLVGVLLSWARRPIEHLQMAPSNLVAGVSFQRRMQLLSIISCVFRLHVEQHIQLANASPPVTTATLHSPVDILLAASSTNFAGWLPPCSLSSQ